MDIRSRARFELKPYQSNIAVRTAGGARLRAQWDTVDFVDFEDGDPIRDVVDFRIDHTLPEGGFCPNQYALKL